jgi:hypothetical protein
MKEKPVNDDALPGDDSPGAESVGTRLASLTEAVERLARSHQALLEARGGASTAPAADGGTPTQPAGRDELRRIVGEVLAERDSSARRSEARQRYVREHLADLPEAYRRQVPETDDPAALAVAEREVRRRYREDFRDALGRFAHLSGGGGGEDAPGGPGDRDDETAAFTGFRGAGDVGGDAAGLGGQRPGAAVDWSKLSPLQQITMGLRDARPQGPPARARSDGAWRGAAAGATRHSAEAPGGAAGAEVGAPAGAD